MPSTDRRLEKTSMAQTISQPALYADGAVRHKMSRLTYNLKINTISTYDIPLDRTFP